MFDLIHSYQALILALPEWSICFKKIKYWACCLETHYPSFLSMGTFFKLRRRVYSASQRRSIRSRFWEYTHHTSDFEKTSTTSNRTLPLSEGPSCRYHVVATYYHMPLILVTIEEILKLHFSSMSCSLEYNMSRAIAQEGRAARCVTNVAYIPSIKLFIQLGEVRFRWRSVPTLSIALIKKRPKAKVTRTLLASYLG